MDSIQINIQESNDLISVILQEDGSVVSVNILEQDTNINVSVAEFLSVAGGSSNNTQLTQAQIEAMGFSTVDNNTQLSDADITALGYVKTDNDTQLSDADITALGYIKTYTDNDTQLSDADITALGYIKTYTDNNTQLSDADITALGYVKTDNDTQLSDADITALGYVKTDNNTQLSDADITALGYVKTDNDTQLTDSDITALGYVKTDNNTQLSDADITALGYVKTDNDTQLTDADITAFGYVKTDNDTQSDWNATSGAAEILNKPTAVADLTNHYLKVSLPASHLTGGASIIDFDLNGDNLVSGLSQDDIAGTFISFADDKFTVSEDGMYTFNTSAEYKSSVTQRVTPAVTFRVNGVLIDGKSLAYIRQVGAVDEGTTNLSRTLILTAGDEVEVYYNNQGQINTGSTATAEMFMVEAYSNSMTVTGLDYFTLITTLSEASSRTLSITDRNKNIENSASITITVPTNATVAFPIGTQISFTKKFATLLFAASGGVTINSVGGLLEMGRINCGAELLKIGTNEWNLIGELV